jgi:AcrR family transcriptional regulator
MPAIPELEAIRKAQILDAALQTIAANGHANVTMNDICKAAGLSKGGLGIALVDVGMMKNVGIT